MKIRKAKIEDVEQIIPIMVELQKVHIEGREDIFKNKEYKEAKKRSYRKNIRQKFKCFNCNR